MASPATDAATFRTIGAEPNLSISRAIWASNSLSLARICQCCSCGRWGHTQLCSEVEARQLAAPAGLPH